MKPRPFSPAARRRLRSWLRLTPSSMLTALLPAALTLTVVTTPEPVAARSPASPEPVTVLTPGIGNGAGEYSPDGELLYNARFPAGVNSYRACRLPWRAAGSSH